MTREERLEAALREAVRHITYLHDKFGYAVGGNAVLARAYVALDAPPAAEEPSARVPERGEGRWASTGLQEPVTITRIACPQSNLPLDPAERGFVGAVYTKLGPWKPTSRHAQDTPVDPTIEANDPA